MRALKFFGLSFVLFFGGLAFFLANLDFLRPQVTTWVNQRVPARVELGRLSLDFPALFKGRALIYVDSVQVEALGGGRIFHASHVQLDFALTSVWQNAPVGTVSSGLVVFEGKTFSDLIQKTNAALRQTVEQVMQKVPLVQGQIRVLPEVFRYETVSSELSVLGGVLKLQNFQARAAEKQGLDVSGSAQFGLVTGLEGSIQIRGEVVDRDNLTQMRDLAVEKHGIRIEHILAEGKSPVRFVLQVGCTWKEPCVSYQPTVDALGSIAMVNLKAGIVRNQAVIGQKIHQFLEKIPQGAQNLLGGLKAEEKTALKELLQKKLQGLFKE